MFGKRNGDEGDVRRLFTESMMAHPKVPLFIANVRQKGFCEGMEVAVAIRYPDGSENKTGIRLKQCDVELLTQLIQRGKEAGQG